ncbi:MAG TPA: hypothetical protein VLA43_17165, partial [Longimicrobiales bacterium]|nr:hypothetical protein [Longimicrobiales bacterium]
MDLLGGVEEVLAEGPAVRHQERGAVGGLGRLEELHHVRVDGGDGQGVLDPGIAVHGVGELDLEVQPALRGGHDLQLLGGVDDPLTLLAVPRHVHLQR